MAQASDQTENGKNRLRVYLSVLRNAIERNAKKWSEQRMIGYPMNTKDTAQLLEVRAMIMEKFTVLNNCLDPFDNEDSHWKNHSLTQEKHLVMELSRRFLPQASDPMLEGVWGHVTAGGSESNLLGVKLACDHFRIDANRAASTLVLYTDAAHHSVPKTVRAQMRLPCCSVPVRKDGTVDEAEMAVTIRVAKRMHYRDFICVLTLGTTFHGAIDDPRRIKQIIHEEMPEARVYIHLDAALHGGFYDVCTRKYEAPKFVLGKDMNSVSISMHKWFGGAICSLFITTQTIQPDADRDTSYISYLGSVDRAMSCSRDGFNAPLWLARLAQFDWDAEYDLARQHVVYALDRFRALDIPAWCHEHSVIIVFPAPSLSTCSQWQLATSGGLAHMVVVPSVARRDLIDEFFAHLLRHSDVDVMKSRQLVYDDSGWAAVATGLPPDDPNKLRGAIPADPSKAKTLVPYQPSAGGVIRL